MFYDRNDNGLYLKTDILANVALGRNVNYDCNIQSKGMLQTEL